MSTPIVPDLLGPGLRLVFCGSAPSRISAQRQAYYANPGNKFWGTLHAIGLTDSLWAATEYRRLLALGVGLTDLNKRDIGIDSELSEAGFDIPAFKERMRTHRPRTIAFTSKFTASRFFGRGTGAIEYGRQDERFEGMALFVLPSTSGLATKYFQVAHWQALALAIGDPGP